MCLHLREVGKLPGMVDKGNKTREICEYWPTFYILKMANLPDMKKKL